ncbi:hypothetical protein JL722_12084 [Aureococcus anophagefferens]|nr:hypothetical protein JL722_12084 [Aureococcus anophagefferens]
MDEETLSGTQTPNPATPPKLDPRAPAKFTVIKHPEILRTWREAGALADDDNKDRSVVAIPLSLDASWATILEAVEAYTVKSGGKTVNHNTTLRARRLLTSRDFDKVGVCWKRRDVKIQASQSDRDLWVKRTVALGFKELRYFEGGDSILSAAMNDLGKPRGSMAADPATKLRVAEAAPAAAAAKDDDDDDDGPRYFRDSAADTTTPPKPPLGAPTEHVLEVCHNNTEWLLCFEEAADLVAWRDAIHAARLDAKPPVPPEIFDLECASTTSNDAAARSRFGVFRCAGDCRGALKAVLRAVRDDEKGEGRAEPQGAGARAASDGEADGDATVALDGAVLADIDRAVRRDAARRFKPKRDACDAARRDALAGLEKVVAVVRKAYAEARVDLPPDVELEVPPPPPLSGGAIVDVWSAETFARDAAEVVARAFKDDAVDANLSARSRASLLNRAARDAAASLGDAADAREAAGVAELEKFADVAEAAVAARRRRLVDDVSDAVRAGAWIGQASPSADLWQRNENAALAKDVALGRWPCTRDLATPGTLWVARPCLYWAPNASVAGLLSVFGRPAAKDERHELRNLREVARVPSPVPLKKNAIRFAFRGDGDHDLRADAQRAGRERRRAHGPRRGRRGGRGCADEGGEVN